MKLGKARHSRNLFSKKESRDSRLPPIGFSQMNLKKILVPVDFSECSRKAFHYAVSLAKRFDSEVLLLHVIVLVPPPPDVVVIESDALAQKYHGESARHLSSWRKGITPRVPVKVSVRHGMGAHQEIVAAARESNSDLIIIGNQGRTALARILMGSTAERVVRHAPCPVLVIRKQEHDFLEEEEEAGASKIRGKRTRASAAAAHPA